MDCSVDLADSQFLFNKRVSNVFWAKSARNSSKENSDNLGMNSKDDNFMFDL